MLNDTKRDLTYYARQLSKPYEQYSINELADAYCDATDGANAMLQNIYISALILRFWYQIPKLYNELQSFRVDHTDCYDGILSAILQACDPNNRKWRTSSESAEQIINQIIKTRFAAAVRYEANLQKNAGRHLEVSLDTPICGGDGDDFAKTLGDTVESDEGIYDFETDAMTALIQGYINRNKIIEAILIDNIVHNDVQKHFKKIIKTTNSEGEAVRYTEHSSQFWPYRLVQIVSKLPNTYKKTFMMRYDISEEKLTAVLDVIDKSNNQKLYRYLKSMLSELSVGYSV